MRSSAPIEEPDTLEDEGEDLDAEQWRAIALEYAMRLEHTLNVACQTTGLPLEYFILPEDLDICPS